MAINVSFNGATIYKPGSYSKFNIDQSGALPLGQTGIIGVIGESSQGKPGSEELDLGLNVFTADQMVEIKSKYGNGAIVDACSMLFAPASDGAIPSGAQAIFIYKSNASTRAFLDLIGYGKVRAKEYGVGGNRITFKSNVTAETAAKAVSSATFDLTSVSFALGDSFSIRIDGSKLYTFTFPVNTIANKSDLVTALLTPGNWSDAAIITSEKFEIRDGNPSGDPATQVKIIVTMDDENSVVPVATHTLGKSRTLELIDGVNAPLAKVNLAAGFYKPASEAMVALQLTQKRDTLIESLSVGGNIVLEAGCSNAVASAEVVIDSSKVLLKEAGSIVATFNKATYKTMKDLVEDMSLVVGWTLMLSDELFGQMSPAILDNVTANALSALNKPARIKKDAYEVAQFFVESSLADIVSIDGGVTPVKACGLVDAKTETLLASGALGATSMSDINSALTIFEGIRMNSIIPLFSRDAAADIADSLTDSVSDYTIDAIHQAVKNHLSKTATTKERSERQAYLSLKKSFADCQIKANVLADFRAQLFIQDTKNSDSDGELKWFQPWALACLVAGARAGSPVGTPITFKYMNCSGIRHTAQAMSTDEQDIVIDFNPRTQYEAAIKSGIVFLENPQTGGFRVVLDNTTYGKDGNWVRNRANVQYAADVLVYDYRSQLESIYVGVKNTLNANEVKSVCESILAGYLAQGITVASDDAPNGFKGLTVQISGNTITTSFIAKLCEGIDFIFSNITVSRKTSTAV
jgi:hypothetical protein